MQIDVPPAETGETRKANPDVPEQKKRLKRRVIITCILLLMVAIPFFPKNKNTKPINQDNPLIATVQNQPIHLSDVHNVALEQYLPSAVDKTALQLSYDILIERLIIDMEAKKLSLTVSNEEIDKKLKETMLEDKPVADSIRLATKYDLLREKIIKAAIKSREAYSIGFYIASYEEQNDLYFTPEEQALISRQRLVTKQALNQIEQKLRQGELPLHIAKSLFNSYSPLQPIIAVNGYILHSTKPEKVLENPKLYTYDEYVEQPFFIDVYTMQPNEIKKVEEKDGSGGYVIQVKSVNPSGEGSYTKWLENKKRNLIKTYNYKI